MKSHKTAQVNLKSLCTSLRTPGRVLLVATATWIAVWPNSATAQNRITVHELSESLTMLSPNEGSGNTLIYRGLEGSVLVDTMADSISTDFMQALTELGVDDVRYVFNTHWHQNHLGGNNHFSGTATIVAPTNLRSRIQEDQVLTFLVRDTFSALPEAYWPTLTFDDEIQVHFNLDGEEIIAWHVQGHTDSDAIIYFPGQAIAATGDLWTPGGGMIMSDIDTGGSLWGVLEALDGLLEILAPNTQIMPGHGRIATVPELRAYRDGLSAALTWIAGEMESGSTIEQIQASTPPEAAQVFMGRGAERFIEAAVRVPAR